MIKILFVIHDLSVGGAEKVLVNLVNNLDTEKFDITVMSLFDGGINKQFLSSKVKYISCFKKMFRGNSHVMKMLTPKQLHQWLIKDHYDIEVSYLEGPTARIVSGCTAKDTKIISWIHIEQKNKKNAARAFRNYIESYECYKRFDKIVCVSDEVRQDFLSLYNLRKVPSVLYNTNDTEKIRKLATERVFFEKEVKNIFRIVGVGKVVENKGFDRLARIHKRLIQDGYPVHTYILGVGCEQEKIEKFLHENQLEKSFTFLGYQTNPYKYIQKCDLFVCTSFAEGFSTAATEALIVGTPVVTTPVAGMKEMLGVNNEYGIITEQDETSIYENIKMLLDNQKLLNEYKQKAYLRGREFSMEKTVQSVECMLIDLLTEN